MIQVQRGTSNTIRASFYDGEAPVTAVSATLGVVASDGTALVAPGTGASPGTNEWTHLLAPVNELDRLTATWTGLDADSNVWATVQTIEVVGAFYFLIADLESMPDIRDNEDFDTGRLVGARQWSEAKIERACLGNSFVERFYEEIHFFDRHRRHFEGHRHPYVELERDYPRRLIGVSIDGTAQSLDDFTLRYGVIVSRRWPPCWSEMTVRYVAGFSWNGATPEAPKDLSDAARQAARNRLLGVDGSSGIPDRARGITTQSGASFSLSTAGGPDHPTGYDEVDEVICGWRDTIRIPAVS